MTTHQVLVAAKGYLLDHGWRGRGAGVHGEPRCTIGALSSVMGDMWFGGVMGTGAYAAMLAATGAEDNKLGVWNDTRRSVDEVIDAFDRAIWATAPKDTPAPEPEKPLPLVTV